MEESRSATYGHERRLRAHRDGEHAFDPTPGADPLPQPLRVPLGEGPTLTTFVFRVRNVPAALYKALGGFATNGINMVKLESYIDGAFQQARFLADIMGHPDEDRVRLAFEELEFFAHDLEILGVYPADPFRQGFG